MCQASNDETRNEFSRELHDSVGPLLTAVGLQVNTLRSSPNISSELKEQLEEVSRLNAEAFRQVRDLAMGIRPALPTDINVVAALEHLVRQFSRRSGIAASVRADANLDHLPEEHRACIYRCISEALTNCAKHSQAKNIRILVALSEGSVTVQVEDDGVGIERSRHRMGLGLIGMRERVSRLKGRFSLGSRQRGGTSITLEIPAPRGVLA
jgi:signal transduction histidine kinase